MAYAENTSVPIERSKAEIERLMVRYGADQFCSGWEHNKALIRFRAGGWFVRFELELPEVSDFHVTSTGRARRSETAARVAWEQACRQKWRALALVLKAKLEAISSGISTFEDEFLAHVILPNGSTVGQFMVPQLEHAYTSGRMPALLPMLEGK